MAKKGHFPQNGQKVPFWGSRDPGRAGFYINPSRRGPAVPAGVPRGPETSRSVKSLQAAAGLERAGMGVAISVWVFMYSMVFLFWAIPARPSDSLTSSGRAAGAKASCPAPFWGSAPPACGLLPPRGGGTARGSPGRGVAVPGLPEALSGTPGDQVPGDPPGTAPGNRGAPARGVDVKPPSAGGPGPGPGTSPGPGRGLGPPPPPGRGIPGSGIPGLPGPLVPETLPDRSGTGSRAPRALGGPLP